jgi:hypothetical protein
MSFAISRLMRAQTTPDLQERFMLLAVRVGRSVASHVEDPRAMVATTYAGLLTWADLTPARSGQKDYCRALIKQAGLSLFLRQSFATRPAFRDLRALRVSSTAAL